MSLYQRQSTYTNAQTRVRSDAGIFVRQTYALFALSLLAASIGSVVGVMFLMPLFVGSIVAPLVILAIEIGLIWYLYKQEVVSNAAIALLMLFGFVSGVSLCGIIGYTLATGGAIVLAQALFLTTLAFAGLSVYAFVTKRDFSVFGSALFIAVLILIGASLLNLFLHSSMLGICIAAAGAIIFSFFIIYDTQMLIRGAYKTPIQGAIALYLDFINLFVSLLQILNEVRR